MTRQAYANAKCTSGLLLGLLVGGCHADWSKPTKSVAETTHQAVGAFMPIFDIASRLCYQEIALESVENRLDLGNWGTEPLLGTWAIGAFDKDGKRVPPRTEADKACVARSAGDDLLRTALAALDEYAIALGALADNGAFDARALNDLAKDAGDFARQVAANSSAATSAASAMSTVATPIGDLANRVTLALREREIRSAIRAMNPVVTVIVNACRAYVAATQSEARTVRRSLIDKFNAIDVRIAKSEAAKMPLPKDALDLYGEATREGESIAATERCLTEFLRVLDGLKDAHDSLYKAATVAPEQPSLDAVLAAVSSMLRDIETLKGLVSREA